MQPNASWLNARIRHAIEFEIGSIASKSEVGIYSLLIWQLHAPARVSSIVDTVNGVTNPTYTYDANGNPIVGAGRTVTCTTFNMAASFVQGSTTIGLRAGLGNLHRAISGCSA